MECPECRSQGTITTVWESGNFGGMTPDIQAQWRCQYWHTWYTEGTIVGQNYYCRLLVPNDLQSTYRFPK